jgi:UV DNA damage endonuclease
MMRLGFPVKVLGVPGLKSNDSRRWRNLPHLRVSLEYLNLIFDYLDQHDIRMYRMSSDLAPYSTHPDMPEFHGMIRECDRELRRLGARASSLGLRLSFHLSQFVVMNATNPVLMEKSLLDIESQAEILNRMALGPEAVVVIHTGGVYGDRKQGCERWVQAWEKLSPAARSRLVLEHDDLRYGPADILWIQERTGVSLVFDHQHYWCFNPEGMPMRQALTQMLKTWNCHPKIHYSSPRTEMREIGRLDRETGKTKAVLQQPLATQHAAFANPFDFITFVREFSDLSFDVMLESKGKDLALLRLRQDLLRFAPDIAARFGVSARVAATEPPVEIKTSASD